jgi:hypothetical protein
MQHKRPENRIYSYFRYDPPPLKKNQQQKNIYNRSKGKGRRVLEKTANKLDLFL